MTLTPTKVKSRKYYFAMKHYELPILKLGKFLATGKVFK